MNLFSCFLKWCQCLASAVASCEELSWTLCVCVCVRVKYFLLFVLHLPSVSFIKYSLVLCIWGEKWRKVPCFLCTTQDLIHVIIHDVIFPHSPCFSGLQCSCLLGHYLHRSCFIFLPLYQSFTLSFTILSPTFWDGRDKICHNTPDVATPWTCLACAKDILHRPEGMGKPGYKMFRELRALCCTALRGLRWLYLSVRDACVKVDVTREYKIRQQCLQTFPLGEARDVLTW